jgi:hypothetical protein
MEACGQDGRGTTWAVAPTRRRRRSLFRNVGNYQISRRHIREKRRPQVHRCESLKSRKIYKPRKRKVRSHTGLQRHTDEVRNTDQLLNTKTRE